MRFVNLRALDGKPFCQFIALAWILPLSFSARSTVGADPFHHCDQPGIMQAEDILEAFVLGAAEVKQPKIVQIAVACIYRLIDNGAIVAVRTRERAN